VTRQHISRSLTWHRGDGDDDHCAPRPANDLPLRRAVPPGPDHPHKQLGSGHERRGESCLLDSLMKALRRCSSTHWHNFVPSLDEVSSSPHTFFLQKSYERVTKAWGDRAQLYTLHRRGWDNCRLLRPRDSRWFRMAQSSIVRNESQLRDRANQVGPHSRGSWPARARGVVNQWGPPVGAMLLLLGWNEGWLARGYGSRKRIWAQPIYSPFFLFYFIFCFYVFFISNYKFEFDSNFTLICKCIIKVPAWDAIILYYLFYYLEKY
jgi:hypothetical protein